MVLCEKCREREAMSPERKAYLDTCKKGYFGRYAEHSENAKKGWVTVRANKIKRKKEEKEAIENAKRIREKKYGK